MAERSDWPAYSLLAQFRPEPGWELERACIASYSADVRVVTAALLALGGHANEPEMGSKVQLIQAFRNLRGRASFVVQRGRILWPRNLPKVAALLDRFVFEAPCNERKRSWHPKFAIMRWRQQDGGAQVWRAWLGSRNLTRDLSRDAGLLLTEAENQDSGPALPALGNAVKTLQTHLPRSAGRFTDRDLEDLAAIRWAAPKGVAGMQLHWLDGTRNAFPTMRAQRRVIVVSPFVDATGMEGATKWMEPGRKAVLIASEANLAQVCRPKPELASSMDLLTCAAGPEEGAAYEHPAVHEQSDEGDTERELDRSDEAAAYHAKLIYTRSGSDKRLWLGSPNLTDRGWSKNFEIVAELTATGKDPWGPALEEIAGSASRFEPSETPASKAKDTLEDLRKDICVELECHQERLGERMTVVATRWPAAASAGIELLVGLPWANREPVVWPWNQSALPLGEVRLEECSDYLLFVLRKGEEETGWLMHAPFRPALRQDRDTAAVASYLGPGGYLDLIRAELEPARASAPPWDTSDEGDRGRSAQAKLELGLPTLEGLLRLYLREPERLRAVAATVAMLEQEAIKWGLDNNLSKRQREDLAAFRHLWSGVGAYLTKLADGTGA